MSRVYISMLGTNNYVPCTYVYPDGFTVSDVRFVQEASMQYYLQTAKENDRVAILVTKDAHSKNWLNNGHLDQHGNVMLCEGLGDRLEKLGLKTELIFIPEGHSEDQIWNIFNKIYEALFDEDSVTFDITHSFRSIPMLVMVVLNYAKVLKDISIERIDYGAFEKLGSIKDVVKMALEARTAPMIDLRAFADLMDWTAAIDEFISSGNTSRATVLAKKELAIHRSADRSQSQELNQMSALVGALNKFGMDLTTCRGRQITKDANNLKIMINKCKEWHYLPKLNPLLEKLERQIAVFGVDGLSDGINAARWCLDHQLIQQGFTILEEFLISHLVTVAGGNPFDRNDRTIANQAVKIYNQKIPVQNWYSPACNQLEMTNKFLAYFRAHPALQNLSTILNQMLDFRNDLNHAEFTNNCHAAPDFERMLRQLISKVQSIFLES